MRPFFALLVCALALTVFAGTDLAAGPKQPPKGKKKDHGHTLHGVVIEVQRDRDKDNGSFTLRTRDKGQAKKGGKDDTRKIQVLPVTKFEKISGDKRRPASFKDLHEGDHVRVHLMDDRPNIARLVEIVKKKDHTIRGTVAEVSRDGDKDNGSMTVKSHDRDDKKASKDRDDLHKFQVLPVTKFEIVRDGQHKPAAFKDVHEGQHVEVYPMDDRPNFASRVEILGRDRK
jgi:hypothetical protein